MDLTQLLIDRRLMSTRMVVYMRQSKRMEFFRKGKEGEFVMMELPEMGVKHPTPSSVADFIIMVECISGYLGRRLVRSKHSDSVKEVWLDETEVEDDTG